MTKSPNITLHRKKRRRQYAPRRGREIRLLMALSFLEKSGPNSRNKIMLASETSALPFEQNLIWLLRYNLIRLITYSTWENTKYAISQRQSKYIYEITNYGREYLQKGKELAAMLGD